MKKNLASIDWTLTLTILYILIVIWIILFKMQFSLDVLDHSREWNLIPFAATLTTNEKINFSEIWNNILIFIPLGIYTTVLKPKTKLWKKFLPILLFSMGLEISQYVLAIGRLDITDIITNSLGGLIGIGVATLSYYKMKNMEIPTIFWNALATIGTILLVAFFITLWIVNG